MEHIQEEKTSIKQAVRLLIGARHKRVRRLAGVRGLWVGLTLFMLLFYLDAVLHLDGRMRMGLGMTAGLVIVVAVMLTVWRLNRTECMEKMLARLIEHDHPEMGNDLMNAIEFEEQIDLPNETFSRVLMHQGIERAAQSFDLAGNLESLKPPTLRKESIVLLSVLGVWLLAVILFSGWMLTEMPRFAFPFGDHPPYSPTQLVVEPAGAIVDYAKALTVHVTAKGRVPKAVSLAVRDPSDGTVSRIPMFQSQEGKFFQSIEDVRTPLAYWANIERGRSKYYRIELCKDPRIEAVHVRYHYPGYARLPERATVLSSDQGELKAYRDTEVTMTVASNRPLASGKVVIGGSTYPCRSQGDNTVQAVFPLKAEGPFSVAIEDVEGNTCTEPFAGTVTIIPDDRPIVSIVSPGMNSLATPTAQVPIVIEAQDDLGIKDVSFFRSHNESDDARKRLFLEDTPQIFVSVAETLDLADLGVRPGDVIAYYATATDSWPDAPQTAASAAFRLQIISEDQYAQMMQSQMTAKDLRLKYDNIISQMTELIETQKQLEQETSALLDAMTRSNDSSISEALREQLGGLQRRQNELRERTDALAQKLDKEAGRAPVFDIEKDYKEFLGNFAKNLTQASGHMAASEQKMQEGSADDAGHLASVSQAVVQQREALEALGAQTEDMKEKIQQANRAIERAINLLADVETFKALYLAQQQLTRHTQTFREVDDPDFDTKIRLKELGEREASIQEDLEALAERLRAHAEEIKEEFPVVADDAVQIADEIAERKITDLMGAGADYLNRGSGVFGYPKVLEALKQMEEMIAFCESAGGKACENCQLRLKIQMMLNPGNTLSQLSQGFSAGLGVGMAGALGSGAAGYAGGQSDIAIFGGDTFGKDVAKDPSTLVGARKAEGEAVSAQFKRDPLAGNIEELTPQTKRDDEFEVEGDTRMMSEYRPLIEAYFRRLAEEQ